MSDLLKASPRRDACLRPSRRRHYCRPHRDTRDRTVSVQVPRTQLDARIGAFSDAPASPDDVLSIVERDVMGAITAVDHPRFYAFVPGPGSFVGAMADALSSGFNVFAGHWLAASGPGAVELQTIELLRQACGFPPGAGGLFLSGGSMANLSGLATARAVKLGGPDPKAMIYLSDQAHSSVAKGLRVLGFASSQVRSVPVDEKLRMETRALHDGDGRRCAGWEAALLRRGQRRHHQHRRGRSSRGHRRALQGERHVASRRWRLWRGGGAHRSWSFGTAWPPSRRLDCTRPAQVAVPAVRDRLCARARHASPATGVCRASRRQRGVPRRRRVAWRSARWCFTSTASSSRDPSAR